MEYEIKRFNLWSSAKIIFVIFLIFGFLLSIFYFVVIGIFQNFIQSVGLTELEEEMISVSGISGFFMVIFFSMFYSIIFTIFSLFTLVLYNITSGIVGGIKFTTDKELPVKINATIQTENSQ